MMAGRGGNRDGGTWSDSGFISNSANRISLLIKCKV